MNFLSIDELRDQDGLRVVVVSGTPSPWGQAAKAMMEYKELDYAAGLQIPGGDNEALVAWAGVNTGPVVAWNDEKPLDRWLDILNLLERIGPEKPLLPPDRNERAEVIGLANEVCGELGLGWNRRLSLFRPALESGQPPDRVVRMGEKHGYNELDVRLTVERQVAGLNLLAERLERQRARGSEYFVGKSLSAIDFYWAGFSTLFALPPEDKVPVGERRPYFETLEPEVKAAVSPVLIEHRGRILEQHFTLPMEF